jgi:ribosomal protein S12 methylthiotransferase accessory factor
VSNGRLTASEGVRDGITGDASALANRRPIVFTGPSLAQDEAHGILDAEYRPPIRRGDLEMVAGGSTVVIIDGVFDQHLAVSPTEIREALARGVEIFGASSMGALRAVEVPGVTGVGRVFEMYARGEIEDDDEVAIEFDPRNLRQICEPLVNIRHAAGRLAESGTISHAIAHRIVEAAQGLSYPARNYRDILKLAGLGSSPEAAQLSQMLAAINIKREDAITVLEHVRRHREIRASPRSQPAAEVLVTPCEADLPSGAAETAVATVHLWEFGYPIAFRDVVDFLAFTGELTAQAERAFCRIGSNWPPDLLALDPSDIAAAADRFLAKASRAWQWATEEEVTASLVDLGIDRATLQIALQQEAEIESRAKAALRYNVPAMLKALQVELFLDDLALKRAAARLMSLRRLAEVARKDDPITAAERANVLDQLCRRLDLRNQADTFCALAEWGVTPEVLNQLLEQLALARRLVPRVSPTTAVAAINHLWLVDSPKAAGSRRFSMSTDAAHELVKGLQSVVGITRVSMITGLGTLGIPNAQAFRPDGEWSSTVGSGKSESDTGAKVGAVMEEIEKWAQERFARRHVDAVVRVASYRALIEESESVVDPSNFDLPYDSCYHPDLEIEWYQCEDLASGDTILAPAAAFTHQRIANDIYFSLRGARKTVTTNGLAAGMTIAEALTHALCEFIERHARSMDAIGRENPGAPRFVAKPFLDLGTVPTAVRTLVDKISAAGYRLKAQEIRSEIEVPTFAATILMHDPQHNGALFGDEWRRAGGWAAHPDPETALTMAILEASQTVMSHIAGAREDLTLHARSLGRHERSDSRRAAAFAAEFDEDLEQLDFARITGFTSDDAGADVRWLISQLRAAGCDHVLAMDYSMETIAPVRVVRVVVPGLETINAFHTGLRARRALIADLLTGRVPNRD